MCTESIITMVTISSYCTVFNKTDDYINSYVLENLVCK